jgi:hypothetical protein
MPEPERSGWPQRSIMSAGVSLSAGQQHAKAVRTGIVLSLFLVLLMAALLVGGRAIIDPLLQSAASDREANRVGEIVYTMPDGAFCRHLAFDNMTGEVTERTVAQCDQDIGKRTHPRAGFAWGAR